MKKVFKEPSRNVFLIQTNAFCDSSHLLREKNSWVGTWMKSLNEDLIDVVVIAVKAIANEPKNKFGASTGSKLIPPCVCATVLLHIGIRVICNWQSKVISLRASSPVWVSEVSLARTRERGGRPLAVSPLARAFSRDSLHSPKWESLLAG